MTALRRLSADDPADVEFFARTLHESMKAPLESGVFIKNFARPQIPWGDLAPEPREGRREMARFLLRTFTIAAPSDCR